MWDQIYQYLKGNMETLKKAPIPVLIIGLLLGCLGWYLNGLRYDGIIRNKNSVIDSKDAQIEQLKDSRSTIKTVIFDGNGNVLINMGAEKIIDTLKVKKQGDWDIINVELKTKEHLAHVPSILSMSDSFLIGWDKTERIGEYIIKWTGHFIMTTDDMVPKFKMEIYHKN